VSLRGEPEARAAELQREVDELRLRASRRAEFVALAAHDVRSPLTAIIGSAQTLRQRWAELSGAQREVLLAVIEREADRLAALLDDVFATSRIDADAFSYSFEDVDLAGLVEEAVAAAVAGREIEVAHVIAQELPVTRGDRARLRQVVSNLIENAVKYAPGSAVEVSAMAVGGRVEIRVRDDGDGIAPEDQERIFEQFGRVEGTSALPGTGLGLFISRAIAEAHGGTLEVSSAPGRGATFTLTLPPA
jgi:signal transduction histidine kinase